MNSSVSILVRMCAVILFVLVPQSVFASFREPFVLDWAIPGGFTKVTYGTPAIIAGMYQLPPGWVGNLYLERDAKPTGVVYRLGTNQSSATTTGYFSWRSDYGAVGAHQITIEFAGAELCALDLTCTNTGRNLILRERYRVRSYEVVPLMSSSR